MSMDKAKMKPLVRVGDIDREMTDEEYAVYLRDQKDYEDKKKAKEEAETKRQSALAKLAAIGLTEEEIAAL